MRFGGSFTFLSNQNTTHALIARADLLQSVIIEDEDDGEEEMEERKESRFNGVMDHVAVESRDLSRDVREYEQIGFHLETLYDDWAMLRDERGFGIALLAPGSKHPPHFGLRVDSREALNEAAAHEGRPIKEHRDRSISFYTKGVGGNNVEVIYYPPEYANDKT